MNGKLAVGAPIAQQAMAVLYVSLLLMSVLTTVTDADVASKGSSQRGVSVV